MKGSNFLEFQQNDDIEAWKQCMKLKEKKIIPVLQKTERLESDLCLKRSKNQKYFTTFVRAWYVCHSVTAQ